jgi:hypothetical protein
MKLNIFTRNFALPAAFVAAAALTVFLPVQAAAQDDGGPPPNILWISQEMLRPGMAGKAHMATEQAFVAAAKGAKSPFNYLMMTSMTGRDRALTFMGFDSVAEWEKLGTATMQDPATADRLDSAAQADGKLLDGYRTGIFRFEPEMSQTPNVHIGQMRFMEITVIQIKPGHDAEWNQIVKLHQQIYAKTGVHSAMWSEAFGDDGGLFLVTMPIKSLAELDALYTANRKAWKAASEEQKKQMASLVASAFASIHTNLYAFSPKMSVVSDTWKKEAPDFWGK